MSMFEIVAMIVVVVSALWVMALPFGIYLAIRQLAQTAKADGCSGRAGE